jgi:hypothetical protein
VVDIFAILRLVRPQTETTLSMTAFTPVLRAFPRKPATILELLCLQNPYCEGTQTLEAEDL